MKLGFDAFDFAWSRERSFLASLFFVFFVFASPFFTIYNNSVQVNNMFSIFQVLLCVLVFGEVLNQALLWFVESGIGVFNILVVFLLFWILFVFCFHGDYFRSLYYISLFAVFFAICFFVDNVKFFVGALFKAKVISVFFVSLWFLVGILGESGFYDYVSASPPVYRNIRHFNYDIMLALGAIFFSSFSERD